jgi:hypothetical protein
MVSAVHASARVFRVRTEFINLTREMRVHVLCECGSGAWIAAIAPFPDLFFDERPLIGQSIGEALAWLGAHYAGLRILAEILDSPRCHGKPGHWKRPGHSERKAPARKPEAEPQPEAQPQPGIESQPEGRPHPEAEPHPGMERHPEGKRKARPRRHAAGQCELPLSICP